MLKLIGAVIVLLVSFNCSAALVKGLYRGVDADNKSCLVEILSITGGDNVLNQSLLIKHSFKSDDNIILRPKLEISSESHTITYQRGFFEGAEAHSAALYAATLDSSKREFTFYQNVELMDHRVQTQSTCSKLDLESK